MKERQRKMMSLLPEYGVKDMAVWFRLVVLMRPVLLQGLQVRPTAGRGEGGRESGEEGRRRVGGRGEGG